MAAASRYRKFLRLFEEWPVDKTKTTRDLGAYLREQVAVMFKQGESTTDIDGAECDRIYNSLSRINSNQYKNMYPRQHNNTCSGLGLEDLKVINSTETLEMLQEEETTMMQRWFKKKS